VTRGLLRISDLGADELAFVLELASEMKAAPQARRGSLAGETLACCFDQPSTRTRLSLHAAAHRLGMLPVSVGRDELQLDRGESIEDTARVLSGYVAAIAIRTLSHRTIERLAAAASVPVVNALSNAHHPLQALADLLTVKERLGRLEGLRLAHVGDGNNVAHSLLEAGALAGMDVVIATPPGYEPFPEVVAGALARGGNVTVLADPLEAVRGADVVSTDVWVSMGDDEEREQRLADLLDFQVDEALLDLAKPSAIFLHCLPAHRGEEVTAEVIDGPRSAVWQQAANRLPTAQALLFALIRGELEAATPGTARVPGIAAATRA
jgi:ornithine carbamoyltransferase